MTKSNSSDEPIGKFEGFVRTDKFYLFPDRSNHHCVYVSPITDSQTYFKVENGELCTCEFSSNCAHVKAVRKAHRDTDREYTEEAYQEVSMRERKVLMMEIEDAIERLRELVV